MGDLDLLATSRSSVSARSIASIVSCISTKSFRAVLPFFALRAMPHDPDAAGVMRRPWGLHAMSPVPGVAYAPPPGACAALKLSSIRSDQLDKESARFAKAKHHLRGALSRTHRKIVARIHQRVAFGF